MASSDGIRFLGIAARIRKALHAEKEAKAANEASLNYQVQELKTEQEDYTGNGELEPETKTLANPGYLFDETSVKVSSTTIEFGKFTYILKHLASTKRIDKIPLRIYYQMGIALTLIALLAVIIYIFTGRLTFDLVGVGFLLAGLLAFAAALTAYQQLRSSHTLVFKDAGGNVIQSVMRRDKAVIDRLEIAVKIAISRNNHHNN